MIKPQSETPFVPTVFSRAFVALVALVAIVACGGDDGTPQGAQDAVGSDLVDATSPLDQADGGPFATDVIDAEVLYVGYECERDDECSTGLCYGASTPQGAFEPTRCQSACLQLNDFRRYCDSDRDCCTGTCCIGCGPKEGLCVLTIPSGTGE